MNRLPLLVLIAVFGVASAAIAQRSSIEEELFPDTDVVTSEEGEAVFEPQAPTYLRFDMVQLRALDKITGRFTDFELTVDEPMIYGSLLIDVDVCFQTPPEEVPESAAFLRISAADSRQVQTMAVPRRLTPEEKAERAAASGAEPDPQAAGARRADEAAFDLPEVHFSGWMYASSPGLNALEHPVYDVWVISCSAESPETPSTGRE